MKLYVISFLPKSSASPLLPVFGYVIAWCFSILVVVPTQLFGDLTHPFSKHFLEVPDVWRIAEANDDAVAALGTVAFIGRPELVWLRRIVGVIDDNDVVFVRPHFDLTMATNRSVHHSPFMFSHRWSHAVCQELVSTHLTRLLSNNFCTASVVA